MRRYRILALAGCMFLLAVIYSFPVAWAEGLNLNAKGAILVDAQTGKVLFEQNSDIKWYPASVTKIMTMVLALEAVKDGKAKMEDKVVASPHAASYGGTQVWLEPNETFSLKEMLIAVAVGSANDASVAIAEHLAGSEEAFVEMMNEKAKALGMNDTHFTNSHGLHDPEHYTSPRDLATLSRYGLQFPQMLQFTSIKEYTFREEPKLLVLWNTNKLLWHYPGTDGLKTGTTSDGGRSLASTVERDGMRLIGVVMGVDVPKGHFTESIKLYNFGFANYMYKKVYSASDVVAALPVGKGARDTVPVVPARKVGAVIPKGKSKGEEIKTRVELPAGLTAPVKRGTVVGRVVVYQQGQQISEVDLLAGDDVSRGSWWRLLKKSVNRVLSL